MKFIKKCVALVVAGMATLGLNAETATQKVISLNWSDQAGGNATADSGVFKVTADAWNNFSVVSNTRTGDLKMWDGSASVNAGSNFSIKWASNVYWGCGATDPVMKRYLDDGTHDGVGGVSITVSNIPFETYDVYIICSTDQGEGGTFLPWTVNGASYGGTTWGTVTSRESCVVGENALKVSKLAGNLVLQGSPRNGTQRGCICALQIVEAEAQIVDKDVGSAYTATEAEELQGDIFNLTFDAGATLTLDKDLTRVYNLISEGSITVVGDYVTSENLAKLGLTGVKGGVVRVIDTAAIPEGLAAPTAGWTYRYEGTTALTALPFNSGASFAGKIEIACPVESKDGDAWATLPVHNNKNYIISDGAAIACSNFQSGNGSGSVQSFVQNGGSVTANSDNIGNTTAAAFLLAHWTSTITYTLNDGTVSVPNGGLRLGWDGNGTFTQNGGAVNVKGLRANRDGHNGHGIYNLNAGTLTLGANGIDFGSTGSLVLGGGKVVASETATMTLDAGLAMAVDTTVEVAEGKTLTLNAVLSGEHDLVKTGAGTLVISKVPENYTGAIRVNAGALDVGKNRDLRNVAFVDGSTIVIREAIIDDGTIHVTGVTGNPTVVIQNANGETLTEEQVTVTKGEGEITAVLKEMAVTGKVALLDLPFNGSLQSVGSDTRTFSYDEGPHYTSDNSAVFAYTRPWNGIQLTAPFAAAVYGTVPSKAKTVLVSFGNYLNNIFLASGAKENEVVLISVANSVATELTKMTVPNAATVKHLYAFALSADKKTIDIYLDGVPNVQYVSPSALTFGTGLQVSGWFQGTVSGYSRCDSETDGGVIDELLVYDAPLKANAMSRLSTLFPYASANGLYQRTLDASGSWTQAGAWTKYGETGTTYAAPADGAMAEITVTASEPVTLSLDASEDITTESLRISGGEVKIVKGSGSGALENLGSTTLQAPVTAAYDAVQLLGPLSISGAGSLNFDFTDYPLASLIKPTMIQLTGLAKETEGKVAVTKPNELGSYVMEFALDSASTYVMNLGINREATDLVAPAGDLTITDTTLFVNGEGEEIRFYDDDWIVVNDEKTIIIGENLTHPAKIKVVEGGNLRLNFASGVTQSNYKYDATVKVCTDGVYDIAHASEHKGFSHPIILAGGTLTNTGIKQDVGQRQFWQISLEDDSFVDVPTADNEFGAVNSGWAAHDCALNGHTLTKTGAGPYTLRTANFVDGGTLDAQEGTFILDSCTVPDGATLNFVVARDAQIIVRGNVLAKTGSVTGEGTVIYERGVDPAAIYQDGDWTGVVWIKNMTWDNANLGREGNAQNGAAYKLTGMVARPDNDGCNAPMILADEGTTKALTISTNVTGAASYHFNTVSGSGTFQWNPELTEGDIPGRIFWLKNVADYSGRLVTGNYLQFTIGGTAAGTLTPGAIKVADGATICPGNWTAKSVEFGRTLKVKGAARAVIATVAEEPDVRNVRVTLIDAEGNEKSGYCLKVRAVEGGYEVSVGIKSFVLLIK